MGTVSGVQDQPNGARRETPGQGHDRNKYTLQAEQENPELLVAVRNERDQRRGEVSGRGVFTGRRGRVMQGKLATERGRGLYAKRAHTVEPVFGHIKEVRKVRRFARRGLGARDVEWKLVCATHNLLKLWRHSRT